MARVLTESRHLNFPPKKEENELTTSYVIIFAEDLMKVIIIIMIMIMIMIMIIIIIILFNLKKYVHNLQKHLK